MPNNAYSRALSRVKSPEKISGARTKRFLIQCFGRSSRRMASDEVRGTDATESSGGMVHLARGGRAIQVARIIMIEAARECSERREALAEVLHERVAVRELAHRRSQHRERMVREHVDCRFRMTNRIEHAARERAVRGGTMRPAHHVVEGDPVRRGVELWTIDELADPRSVHLAGKRTNRGLQIGVLRAGSSREPERARIVKQRR